MSEELLVLLRRGGDRILDLCAGLARAAAVAAAGLCRRDRVRPRHRRSSRRLRRPFRQRRDRRRPRHIPAGLAGARSALSLAVDAHDGRAHRSLADMGCVAGIFVAATDARAKADAPDPDKAAAFSPSKIYRATCNEPRGRDIAANVRAESRADGAAARCADGDPHYRPALFRRRPVLRRVAVLGVVARACLRLLLEAAAAGVDHRRVQRGLRRQ